MYVNGGHVKLQITYAGKVILALVNRFYAVFCLATTVYLVVFTNSAFYVTNFFLIGNDF
jgi:hypothetical protein